MKNAAVDIVILVGGLYLYGLKSAVGKWLFSKVNGVVKKILVKTEYQLALWVHLRNKKLEELIDKDKSL